MTASDLAIECVGLRKVYLSGFLRRPFVGLEGLDLAVPRGEIFGFVGPNGAGKTTTIKILMGLQSATAGRATLLGVDCTLPRSKERVGFMPERPYFYEHLTAREFLRFYGQLFDLDDATLRRRIPQLLERVRLAEFADVPLRSFSKGMLQRAGLAQALINDPALLVLDEPMSGLDPMGRMLIRDIIFEEREAGRTVFFSSHILADVELICDRVAILARGRLRGLGTVQELVGATVAHVDCAFRVPGPLDLPGETFRREGEVVQVRLPPDRVDEAIDRVRAAGGSVLQVTPGRRSLEEVLVELVGDEARAPADPRRMGVLA